MVVAGEPDDATATARAVVSPPRYALLSQDPSGRRLVVQRWVRTRGPTRPRRAPRGTGRRAHSPRTAAFVRRRSVARARSAGAGTAPSRHGGRRAAGRARSSPDPRSASGRVAARVGGRACPPRCPASLPSSAATTLAVLRATPGRRSRSSRRSGHLAVELLEQDAHRAADRLRLLAVEAGREDILLQLLDRDGQVVLGSPVLLEEPFRHAIDVHVGRLSREHHGDQQLDVAPEAKRDRRVGVLSARRSTIGPMRSRRRPRPRRCASPT